MEIGILMFITGVAGLFLVLLGGTAMLLFLLMAKPSRVSRCVNSHTDPASGE